MSSPLTEESRIKLIYDEPSSGFSQGIEADLKYLQCNEDKYQLLIRKYIVKELGKDVNGLIKNDFESDNGKTVYLIVVPTYHQIVVFKDKVWQRQGNFTRPLDHSALKFLKEWRTVTKISGQISTAEVEVGHLIPTSRLNRMDDERITIAYFSILASGKYVITTDDPYRNDARITLPIYEDNRDGYLLQIYTNGYVNRVAISMILSKIEITNTPMLYLVMLSLLSLIKMTFFAERQHLKGRDILK